MSYTRDKNGIIRPKTFDGYTDVNRKLAQHKVSVEPKRRRGRPKKEK